MNKPLNWEKSLDQAERSARQTALLPADDSRRFIGFRDCAAHLHSFERIVDTTKVGKLGLTDADENNLVSFMQTLSDGFMSRG